MAVIHGLLIDILSKKVDRYILKLARVFCDGAVRS